MVRVAALQLSFGDDPRENLDNCLRLIDQAAREHRPALMVLPAYTNYPDAAASTAQEAEDPFLAAIAERARQHATSIVVHCSVTVGEPARIRSTSFMFGPDGGLALQSDTYAADVDATTQFEPARQEPDVADTAHGRIALLADDDVLRMETARSLALKGAQVLCQSLRAFVRDEVALHAPARAAENRCFVVAANVVGPYPGREGADQSRSGAGESQIVAPDGEVLAKGPTDAEAIVVADINPALADDKRRPDGTDDFATRRPELYRPLGHKPRSRAPAAAAAHLQVGIWTPAPDEEELVEAASRAAEAFAAEGGELLVLPELFCFTDGLIDDPEVAAEAFEPVVRALCDSVRDTKLHIVTSLVEAVDGSCFHAGLLLGHGGIIARQPQLHACERHPWVTPGKRQDVLRMPYGNLAILVGDDVRHPELSRVAALGGAHLLACPMDMSEPWEGEHGLPSRAAENRVCVIAASRRSEAGGGVILNLQREFARDEAWQSRPFEGSLNLPLEVRAEGPGLQRAELNLDAARLKALDAEADLLEGRPWRLSGPLLTKRLPSVGSVGSSELTPDGASDSPSSAAPETVGAPPAPEATDAPAASSSDDSD